MIYTVTFNPALDYVVRVDDLTLGAVNRVAHESVLPGGKGVNVSIVLANLGHESRALGFVAGFTGAEIERRMRGFGAACDFVRVEGGMSRINVKVKAAEETEINGMGPAVSQGEAPLGTVVNSVGAGDSMVAGFLAGWIETGDYAQALRMGLCTGSASAFSAGLATRAEVEALLETSRPVTARRTIERTGRAAW